MFWLMCNNKIENIGTFWLTCKDENENIGTLALLLTFQSMYNNEIVSNLDLEFDSSDDTWEVYWNTINLTYYCFVGPAFGKMITTNR